MNLLAGVSILLTLPTYTLLNQKLVAQLLDFKGVLNKNGRCSIKPGYRERRPDDKGQCYSSGFAYSVT